jgi:UDP-3-O-[3-hydroxymyristoyl] glucosamine N-acyltransferase
VPETTLSALCERLRGAGQEVRLDGPDERVVGVNTLDDALPGELTFLSNPKYASSLGRTRASAILVRDGVEVPSRLSAVRCADPYAALTHAIVAIHGYRNHPTWGLHPGATVHPSAAVGEGTNIGPGAFVAADAVIGRGCSLYPGVYVGECVRLGDGCVLHPNVVVYEGCVLGSRVTVHAGSVIGQDGLGYAPVGGKWVKIPQVGCVVIGDDVEIGANCAVDRATLGRTEIGEGTKFGNVIVIGHGSRIGPDCMFVGLVGVAGSVTVGRHVTLAGQVGVAGHLTISDDVQVGAQSGISTDVPPGTRVLGSPAIPVEAARRTMMAMPKLPGALRRIKELEQQVAELRAMIEQHASTGR